MQYGIREFSFLPSAPKNSSGLWITLWETHVYRTNQRSLPKKHKCSLFLFHLMLQDNGVSIYSFLNYSVSHSFPTTKTPSSSFHWILFLFQGHLRFRWHLQEPPLTPATGQPPPQTPGNFWALIPTESTFLCAVCLIDCGLLEVRVGISSLWPSQVPGKCSNSKVTSN